MGMSEKMIELVGMKHTILAQQMFWISDFTVITSYKHPFAW